MKFKVSITNIFRDLSQGLYGNRIPLNDPKVMSIWRLWRELVESNHSSSIVRFHGVEAGGAQPQVDSVFLNRDYTETMRQMRQALGNETPIRPLNRGTNALGLKPIHGNDIQCLLQQMADDTAGKYLWNGDPKQRLLEIKVFDSQANFQEVEPVIQGIAALRRKGYPIGVEIAIPYSDGTSCEPGKKGFNPYPDDFFIEKTKEGLSLLKQNKIPAVHSRVTLKDMGGELDHESARRLSMPIIAAIQQTGLPIEFGLHLHDTGLAADAYAAAIAVAKKMNHAIIVDTVEGDNTGFCSTLYLEEALNERYETTLGLTSRQLSILGQMAELTNEVMKDYALRRVDVNMNGADLRKFKIPGGGFSSFVSAVEASKLAQKLSISKEEVSYVAGTALQAVGRIMGYPFAVTPGFQNKQIAALNLLENMIQAGYFKDCNGAEAIKKKLLVPLTDQQVELFFLKGLKSEVKEFLKGPMPYRVHDVVRGILPLRMGRSNDGLVSDLPKIEETARALQKEGKIIPTRTQMDNAISECRLEEKFFQYSDDHQYQIVEKRADEMAYQSTLARGIVLGGAGALRQSIEKSWLGEPLAADFKGRKEAYERAMARFKRGVNPVPDEAEIVRGQLLSGQLTQHEAEKHVLLLLQKERAVIGRAAVQVMEKNHTTLAHFMANPDSEAELTVLIRAIHAEQAQRIQDALAKGQETYYTLEQSVDIAIDSLKEMVNAYISEAQQAEATKHIKQVKKSIGNDEIRSPFTGKVCRVNEKLRNASGHVKKGDELCVIEAMKMEIHILAEKDGLLAQLAIQPGQTIESASVLAKYVEHKQEMAVEEKASHAVTDDQKAELLSILTKLQRSYAKEQSNVHEMQALQSAPLSKENTQVLTQLQQQGYNVPPMSFHDLTPLKALQNAVHIVGNRAGCATKINGDLRQAGAADVRIFYMEGDASTPVIKHADAGKTILLRQGYQDQPEILENVIRIARENPDKIILLHPGWGFLSEKADFVKLIEALKERGIHNVRFAGSPSKAMEIAGGKGTFRDLVQETAPEFNPKYFKSPAKLSEQEQRNNFQKFIDMGGDVVIKAVAGGGGKGIKLFEYDSKITREENFTLYQKTVEENMAYAERGFHDSKMITEQRIVGNARHLEYQLACNAGASAILGIRDCTVQKDGQKLVEQEPIKGDYPEEVLNATNQAVMATVNKLAGDIGYTGLATLEMMVLPDGTVMFLEINTRLQVEHAVTEEAIFRKTGVQISLPVLNALMALHPEISPVILLQSVYGFTNEQIQSFMTPGEGERIVHLRVNAKVIDLDRGKLIPTWFSDAMWPQGITAAIADKTGAKIVQGGLGDGTKDAQIGAIWGTRAQVEAAAHMLLDYSRLAQVFDRKSSDPINLKTTLDILPLLYGSDGCFRSDFGTHTLDVLVKAIEKGDIPSLASSERASWPNEYVVDNTRLAAALDQIGVEGNKKIQPKTHLTDAERKALHPQKEVQMAA